MFQFSGEEIREEQIRALIAEADQVDHRTLLRISFAPLLLGKVLCISFAPLLLGKFTVGS